MNLLLKLLGILAFLMMFIFIGLPILGTLLAITITLLPYMIGLAVVVWIISLFFGKADS